MRVWIQLFGRIPDWDLALAAIAVALILATAIAEVVVSLTRRLLIRQGGHDDRNHFTRATRALVRLLRLLLILVLTGVFVPPILELFGEPLRSGLRLRTLVEWILNGGLRVLLIVALTWVLTRVVTIATGRLERYLAEAPGTEASAEHLKRARTLADLVRNVAHAFIVGAAIVMVLNEVGVNTAPLLTGAGILGLAIGFGAQTLVKDVISGFFLILENQVRVGDAAEINGTGGLVEAITLRTIVLRDVNGAVYVFPCGSVNTLANLTKDYSYAVLDLRVPYRYDTDKVIETLRQTAASLQQDQALAGSILEALEVLGVENLGDANLTIRVRMKTVPLRQWDVARELRRRIKKAFDAAGIELTQAPQTVVLKSPT